MRTLGVWDFVIQRGMFGFGTTFALLTLVWDLYDGESITWDGVKFDIAIKVFVSGPLWGLWMWYYFSRVHDDNFTDKNK